MSNDFSKKVLYILGVFPKISNSFINDEIRYLLENGYEITVFTLQTQITDTITDIINHQNFKGIYSIKSLCSPVKMIQGHIYCFLHYFPSYINLFLHTLIKDTPLTSFIKFVSLVSIVKQWSFQIIYCHFFESQAYMARILSKINTIPYLLKTHGSDVMMRAKITEYERVVVKDAFCVFAVDSVSRNKLMTMHSCGQEKVLINPCGIIIRKPDFSNDNFKKEPFTILFVGRLVEHKGVSLLLNAIKDLLPVHPQCKLVYIGDGPMKSKLQYEIDKNGMFNSVYLIGNQSHEIVYEWYKKASVFVLPSRCEGTPMVIMEAMSMGLPVISTKVGGIPDLIDDKSNGFLIDTYDSFAIFEKLDMLIRNNDLAVQIGKNAAKKALEFDIRNRMEVVTKYLDKAIDSYNSKINTR